MVIPHLVDKHAVHAHGKDFYAKALELLVMIGDRRYFRCSDEGEITWVKTEDNPFSKVIRELRLM